MIRYECGSVIKTVYEAYNQLATDSCKIGLTSYYNGVIVSENLLTISLNDNLF